mmetsp:Transcript_73761/g.196626  ORF Transcript_73761/g.196626 Transcript_73761/m.196626 type:complete len:204 (-) Transcript_73761:347-958(-)
MLLSSPPKQRLLHWAPSTNWPTILPPGEKTCTPSAAPTYTRPSVSTLIPSGIPTGSFGPTLAKSLGFANPHSPPPWSTTSKTVMLCGRSKLIVAGVLNTAPLSTTYSRRSSGLKASPLGRVKDTGIRSSRPVGGWNWYRAFPASPSAGQRSEGNCKHPYSGSENQILPRESVIRSLGLFKGLPLKDATRLCSLLASLSLLSGA